MCYVLGVEWPEWTKGEDDTWADDEVGSQRKWAKDAAKENWRCDEFRNKGGEEENSVSLREEGSVDRERQRYGIGVGSAAFGVSLNIYIFWFRRGACC